MKVPAAVVGSGNIGATSWSSCSARRWSSRSTWWGSMPRARACGGRRVRAGGVRRRSRLVAGPPRASGARVRAPLRASTPPTLPATRWRASAPSTSRLPPSRPYVVRSANVHEHLEASNVNLITCGGQATIPVVHAVSRVVAVPYAEIVASVASVSAVRDAGEHRRVHPHDCPRRRDARRRRGREGDHHPEPGHAAPHHAGHGLSCSVPDDLDRAAVVASIHDMVATVQEYVPGYRLRSAVRDVAELSLRAPGGRLPGSGGGGGLPSPVLRQPGHHDRRRRQGGRQLARRSLGITA